MKLDHFKYGLECLIYEMEKDIPHLGHQSAKYHRYFVETLRNRLVRIDNELARIRFVEVT